MAVYLCNQMIYSPHRRHPRELSSNTVPACRPLRYISPLADPADRRVEEWLDVMNRRYQLREFRTLAVDMAEPGAKPRIERYSLYEFVPRQAANHDQSPGSRIRVDQPVSLTLE